MYQLNQIRGELSTKTIERCFTILADTLKRTTVGRNLEVYISDSKKLFLGQKIQVVNVLDTSNNNVNLNTLVRSHKYTFIDFWASWCAPCRKAMKKLKAQYEDIDAAQIQIISVSIDNNRENWLNASAEEAITWGNYYDSLGVKGQVSKAFNLEYIPQNIIVDKDGIIIEKNLWGESLEAFLKKNNLKK